MGRTRIQIKDEITKSFMTNENIKNAYGFNPDKSFLEEFSLVSFENILFEIISYILFVQEQIFDNHKKEVEDIIEQKMPHRASWYHTKTKAFQYGYGLIDGTDKYDNTGLSTEDIEASKIVKYCSVTQNGALLSIKVATEIGNNLAPLDTSQKEALDGYIDMIADCGVKYVVSSLPADILTLVIDIYRDPLILNENGMSIINANYPVEEAIQEYLKELPFNGELVLAHLTDKLQKVEGVLIPVIKDAQNEVIDINDLTYSTRLEPKSFTVKETPLSGYFIIENFEGISYL